MEMGDDGASARLRSALGEVMRKREMTSGSHIHLEKYLGDVWRTVRRSRADCPRGRCYTLVLQLVPFVLHYGGGTVERHFTGQMITVLSVQMDNIIKYACDVL